MTTAALPPTLNQAAMRKLGWTPSLIKAILGRPDKVAHRAKGCYRWTENLYTRERIAAGMLDPRFLAVVEKRERRKAKEQAPLDFAAKYATWRDALVDATTGMYLLNRFAKHPDCSPVRTLEIYSLKDRLIQMLYERGFCTAAWIDELHQKEKLCRDCDGDGFCDRCGGDGVYRAARTLRFWSFRFQISGHVDLLWHQPAGTVRFQPKADLPPQAWPGIVRTEAAALRPKHVREYLQLIEWLLNAAAEELPEAPLVLPPLSSPPLTTRTDVSPAQAHLL